MKENYLINENFKDSDSEYYIVFRTPDDIPKRVEYIKKIQLLRTSHDSVQLKITTKKGKTHIHHYPNGLITLLDNIDIGIIT